MARKNTKMVRRMQDRQIEYLESMEDKEIDRGMWSTYYPVSCADCHESANFGCAENARKFVEKHEGHRTHVSTVR